MRCRGDDTRARGRPTTVDDVETTVTTGRLRRGDCRTDPTLTAPQGSDPAGQSTHTHGEAEVRLPLVVERREPPDQPVEDAHDREDRQRDPTGTQERTTLAGTRDGDGAGSRGLGSLDAGSNAGETRLEVDDALLMHRQGRPDVGVGLTDDAPRLLDANAVGLSIGLRGCALAGLLVGCRRLADGLSRLNDLRGRTLLSEELLDTSSHLLELTAVVGEGRRDATVDELSDGIGVVGSELPLQRGEILRGGTGHDGAPSEDSVAPLWSHVITTSSYIAVIITRDIGSLVMICCYVLYVIKLFVHMLYEEPMKRLNSTGLPFSRQSALFTQNTADCP